MTSALLDWLTIADRPELPLYRHLYFQIRDAVLDGRLRSGERLPASRSLCRRLTVSRNTVQQAYDQLVADGLLEARSGAGTRVSGNLDAVMDGRRPGIRPDFIERFRHGEPVPVQVAEQEPDSMEFQPGIPAFDTFPATLWARLLRRHALRRDKSVQDYAHPGGYRPLQAALAHYLAASRGVVCRPEQVVIVTSVRAATTLIAGVRNDRGAGAVVEDPGYRSARLCLQRAGMRTIPVPVDAYGLQVDRLESEGIDAALAYVTPTNQWPTCVSLSLERRIALVNWAERHGAWIIEDDYDSEFSIGQPQTAVCALSGYDNAILVGTFSKTMLPSIRCAYLVVPPDRAGEFSDAAFHSGCEPALHVQAALSDFLAEGHFTKYIARMRKVYALRRKALTEAIESRLASVLRVRPGSGGLQLVADVAPGVSARAIGRAAAQAQIVARPIARYYVAAEPDEALHLGIAAVPEAEIAANVDRLARAIADHA